MIYFFDVPVYRLPEERYYAERDDYVRVTMFLDEMQRQFYERNPDQAISFKSCLEHDYGGCWDYNEIIGYIRLHFLGSQIRGEYFRAKAKRIVRTRRKTFEPVTHKLAPEIEVPVDASSVDIYRLVQEYLRDCRHEFPRRYIDTEILDTIGPYIFWRQLFDKSLAR